MASQDYVPACTFSPRSRNRFACNQCSKPNGGGPTLLQRNSVDSHRNNVFARNNPRAKIPPVVRVTQPSIPELQIDRFDSHWHCPGCTGFNLAFAGCGQLGHSMIRTCCNCERSYRTIRT